MMYTCLTRPFPQKENIHGILKQSPYDLGGHHVVFRVTSDPITGEKFMRVDRTPLAAIPVPEKGSSTKSATTGISGDPAAYILDESTASSKTHGSFGWLNNLGPTMRQEATLLSTLYPFHEKNRSNTRWLCPLRRMAFWSSISGDFNPLVPSPVRSARLFGSLQMTHGTRSHPTQLFSSLGRLANVLTTNGFCFCTREDDCLVSSADPGACTLADVISSLYDQKYRLPRMLSPSSCKMQLDWPYEEGTMRDGMPKSSRLVLPLLPLPLNVLTLSGG